MNKVTVKEEGRGRGGVRVLLLRKFNMVEIKYLLRYRLIAVLDVNMKLSERQFCECFVVFKFSKSLYVVFRSI